MPRSRVRRRSRPFPPRAVLVFAAAFAPGFGAGCAGTSPDPVAMAADVPPPAEGPVDTAGVAARVTEALARYEAGEVRAAADTARVALAMDPRSGAARAIYAMGIAEEARREVPPRLALWREAEGELLRADAVDPGDPIVARLRADFLVLDEHRSAAAQVLDAALELHPEDPELLRRAATVHFDLGDERRTVELAGRRLAVAPGDAEAAWQRAESAQRLAAVADIDAERDRLVGIAIDAWLRYRELRPDDPDGAIGEATARRLTIDPEAGPVSDAVLQPILAAWDDVDRLRPTFPAAPFGRGDAFERAGRPDLAAIAYRRALERDERFLPALLNLGSLLASQGKDTEAAPLLRRALTITTDADEREAIEGWLAEHGGR